MSTKPKAAYQTYTAKHCDIIYTNLTKPRANNLKKDKTTGLPVQEYSCTVLLKKGSEELTRFVTTFQKFKQDNFGEITLTHKVAKDGDELYEKLLNKVKAEKQGFLSNEELAEFEKDYGRLKGTYYLVAKSTAREGLEKPLLLQEGSQAAANPTNHEQMGKFFSGMIGTVQFSMATYFEPVKGVTLYLKAVRPTSGGIPFGRKGTNNVDLSEFEEHSNDSENPNAYKAADMTAEKAAAMFA